MLGAWQFERWNKNGLEIPIICRAEILHFLVVEDMVTSM
jgi:hypothetical protein